MNESFTRAPHRRPSREHPRDTAALLIDFDNVTMGIRSNLGQELRNLLDSDVIRGKVAVQRAYADWRRYPQYIVPLSESSIDLIFAPAYGSSKKNATDIRLAIDATELVFTRPEIETFILLSGDSDFSSLVLKLKEYGKYVIGVGLQESTSDILVQNCDEYYSYNRLSGLSSSDDLQTKKHDPWQLAADAVARMAQRGDIMRSDRLKQVMIEIDPGFDEKTVGFSRFNRFLAEAAKRKRLVLTRGEHGQYEVAPVGGKSAASAPTGGKSAAGRSGGRGRRGRRGGRGRSGGGSAAPEAPASPAAPAAEATTAPATAAASSAPAAATAPGQSSRRGGASRRSAKGDSGDSALRSAFEALGRAVREASPNGDPVRDSQAKRKLMVIDPDFSQGSLGFGKFSLFLAAAHEAGHVRLERGENGNHYLTPVSAAPSAAPASAPKAAERRPSATKTAASSGAKPSAKSTAKPGGERKSGWISKLMRRTRGGGASAEVPAQAEPRQTGAAAPRRPPVSERAPTRTREALPKQDAGPKPEAAPAATAEAAPTPQREAAPAPPKAEQPAAPPERPAPEPERRARGEERAQSAAPARRAPARRPLGRHRSGHRGRSAAPAGGATQAPRIGPIGDAPAAESSEKSKPAGDAGREAPEPRSRAKPPTERKRTPKVVEHMVQSYAGVGLRTAEVLYDKFGDEVLEVLDNEPERVQDVLAPGRARLVLAARRAEREG